MTIVELAPSVAVGSGLREAILGLEGEEGLLGPSLLELQAMEVAMPELRASWPGQAFCSTSQQITTVCGDR